MILYGLYRVLLFVLDIILSLINNIPAINSINTAIEPYIVAISNLIVGGINLISFFLPMQLIKILIPIVITIEIIIENLDIIKFALKHTINR